MEEPDPEDDVPFGVLFSNDSVGGDGGWSGDAQDALLQYEAEGFLDTVGNQMNFTIEDPENDQCVTYLII